MSKSQHWSKIEERGSLLGMQILFFIYKLLGRYPLRVVLFPVVLYLYFSGKPARKASKQFLQQVSLATGKNYLKWYSGFKHFWTFADAAFDKVDAWLGRITHERVRYNDESIMEKISSSGKGAVFIGSHLGNLEVCRALSHGRYATKINVLVFTEHAVKFNALLKQVTPEVDVDLIQVSSIGPDTAIALKAKVDNGEIVVIVGDRTSASVTGRVTKTDFLGKPAPFSQGPFILASVLECPLYFLFCLKEPKGFLVHFEHISDQIKLPRKQRAEILDNLITRYAKLLESFAKASPYQWFNFYDFWQSDNASKNTSEVGK